jgi:LysR family transcriptional regulator, regulator of the ytmI operon
MDLHQLKTFMTVIEADGFAKAADQLNCAQSTVTLHVHDLEAELGMRLFRRDGRRNRLTEAGRLLALRAGPLLQEFASLRDFISEISDGTAGHVSLGAIEPSASRRLPAVLAEFCARRPAVSVNLQVAGTRALAAAVDTGELELALCSSPSLGRRLVFEPLFREEMALLVPVGHPMALSSYPRLGDLNGHRLLVTEMGCAYRQTIEVALERDNVRPRGVMEIGSVMALCGSVQAGIGVAFVPQAAVIPTPTGTVVRRLKGTKIQLEVGLLSLVDIHKTAAAKALIELMRHRLARRTPRAGTPAKAV